MRGKRRRHVGGGHGLRNIPAYAGKTCAPPLRAYGCWEHPRVCGENVSPTPLAQFEWGTSPRMRGKRLRPALFAIENGNIPAYAGKTEPVRLRNQVDSEHPRVCGETRPCSIMGSNWSEHPRVCGENLHAGDKRQVRGGTSPRMRGKPELTRRMTRTLRNIPAYAGKTLQLQPDQVILEEHPRVCGENCFIIIAIIFACGTSPRMRGKLPKAFGRMWDHRNIPAYAGKTFSSRVQQNHYQGTSPRMRGKLALFQKLVKRVRNIPAYAGKTCLTYRKTQLPPEHPRVCGENRAGSSIVLV